tara:strand:- start:150 stop:479 length:330 start_codon:yes stop_codon:yes gene_type:complete
MFNIKLDINNYNLLVLNDLARMFIIQITVQVLYYLRHDDIDLFSSVFLENTLFILLGIFIYWLIFNNIVIFTNDDTEYNKNSNKDLDTYYQNIYSFKGNKNIFDKYGKV